MGKFKTFGIAVLFLGMLLAVSCGKKVPPEAAIHVGNAYVSGDARDYVTVVDGDYTLKCSDNETIRLMLKFVSNGEFDIDDFRMNHEDMAPGGSVFISPSVAIRLVDKDGASLGVKSGELRIDSNDYGKLRDLLNSQDGTQVNITFKEKFSNKDAGTIMAEAAGIEIKGADLLYDKTAEAASKSKSPGESISGALSDLADDTKKAFSGSTQAPKPSASGKRVVAVPDVEGTSKISKDLITSVTGAMTSGLLANSGVDKVVDQNQIQRIMKQHKFEMSDWSDSSKYAEIGKALNVDTICVATMAVASSNFLVTQYTVGVQLIDINTMGIVGAANIAPDTWVSTIDRDLPQSVEKAVKGMKLK